MNQSQIIITDSINISAQSEQLIKLGGIQKVQEYLYFFHETSRKLSTQIFGSIGFALQKQNIQTIGLLFPVENFNQSISMVEKIETQSTASPKLDLWVNSYPWSKCIWELSYLSFTIYLWYRLIRMTVQIHQGPLPVVIAFVFSLFLVDFVSGVLHWAADTWGKFETPIFGPTIIRSFRMHHVDPQDITRHSFVETNASSSYPLPFLIFFCYLTTSPSFLSQTWNWTVIFSFVLAIMTNEIHKWSHMEHIKPNFIIRFLQKSGLIISHEKHHVHHIGKFDSDYCIINGWMNPFLQRINFWRRMQALITKVTGCIPRQDDEFWRSVKPKGQ